MFKPSKLNFATAGFPTTTKGNVIDALNEVVEHNLDGMELEFVQSTWLKPETAKEVKKVVEKNNLILTCHGSYFINLASEEKQKVFMSRKRIIDAAEICSLAGVYSLTFHAAYYQKLSKPETYKLVKTELQKIIDEIKERKLDIWIRPELTGKETQFGDLDELIKLSNEFDNVLPCIDFSHLHARYNGKFNTKKEWNDVFEKLEKELGRNMLDNMHIHLSGINYGNKGEKNHLPLKESDLNWQDLLDVFKEYKVKGVVVCESPNIEEDAKLMKHYFQK